MERTPPQDVEAEQSVLGGAMLSADALAQCRTVLVSEDFYRPAHTAIWQACCELQDRGEPVDAVTVAAQLSRSKLIAKVGGHNYLHTLISGVPTAANAGYYAEIVAEKAQLRRLVEAATRIAQMAYGVSDDISGGAADIVERAEMEMRIATQMVSSTKLPDGLHTWDEFIQRYTGDNTDWIVPGMISRQDVILTLAPPGAGKTTLSRQVCHTIAAGLHPFDPSIRIPPLTTLLVDLEVDPMTTADESTGPLAAVKRLGDYDNNRAWIWTYVAGVNLRKPAEARMFESVIAHVKPDLVAFGSLYKAGIQAKGGESYEVAANEVREVFDRLRRRYQFALWLEHHMPKAPEGGRRQSPFGASVWEWWPSHGRILQRAVERNINSPFSFSAPFRGDRGVRKLPAGFYRGGKLPWSPIWDQDELDLLTEGAGG